MKGEVKSLRENKEELENLIRLNSVYTKEDGLHVREIERVVNKVFKNLSEEYDLLMYESYDYTELDGYWERVYYVLEFIGVWRVLDEEEYFVRFENKLYSNAMFEGLGDF